MVENVVAGYNSCMFAYGQVSFLTVSFICICFLVFPVWWLMVVLICRLEVGKLILCLEISREEHVDIVSTAGWHLEFLSICSQGSKRFGVFVFLYAYALAVKCCVLTYLSFLYQEKEVRKEEKLHFTCRCSFLEIYNEQILDLLDPSSYNLQVYIPIVSWQLVIWISYLMWD